MKIPSFSKLKDFGLTSLKISALSAGLALAGAGATPHQLSSNLIRGSGGCTVEKEVCPEERCGLYCVANGSPTVSYTACTAGDSCVGFEAKTCDSGLDCTSGCHLCW